MSKAEMGRYYRVIVLGFIFVLSVAITSSTIGHERSVFTQQLSSNMRRQYSSNLLRHRRATGRTSRAADTYFGTRFTVGTCELESFLRSLKNCSQAFYASARTKGSTRSNCSASYVTLKTCVMNTLDECLESFVWELFINDVDEIKQNFQMFLGYEEYWCERGGLGVSNDYLPSGAVCGSVFYHVAESCTVKYAELFNTSASDDKLCSEYKKAKKCYLETIFQHCSLKRMLLRAVEIVVKVTENFQPFCNETDTRDKVTLKKLRREKTCPPYSLADVAFVLDVTNNTHKKQYVAMKRTVEAVLKTMDYGSRGMQASVFHFDTHLRTIFKFSEVATKGDLRGEVRRMKRTSTKTGNKTNRMTGKSLSMLARKTFSRDKGGNELKTTTYRSGHRPHSAAIVFVMTTGPSTDSMVSGLELMQERNVHVVFVGPSSLKVPTTSDKVIRTGTLAEGALDHDGLPERGEYRVIGTEFKLDEVQKVAKELTSEICTAERKKHLFSNRKITEGRTEYSKWQSIQNILSRLGRYDVSLLFGTKRIVAQTTQATFSLPRPGIGGPFNPVEFIEEGMDGDRHIGLPAVSEERPFEMS